MTLSKCYSVLLSGLFPGLSHHEVSKVGGTELPF